jgi:hypothetical protein
MPINIAEAYLHGMEVRGQLNAAKERVAAERSHTAMEAQARADTNVREAAETNARIQTQKAYHDAELGLKQQQITAAAAKNEQQTRFAALKMAQQHAFNGAVASGMPVRDAMFKYPMASASAETGLERQEGIQHRADTRNQNVGAALDYRKQHDAEVANNKALGTTRESTTETIPAIEGSDAVPASTNWFGGVTAAVPAVAAQPARRITKSRIVPPGTTSDAVAPAAAAKSPHPEGTILVNKKTGARAIVKNGIPVPIDQAEATPAAETDDAEEEDQASTQ